MTVVPLCTLTVDLRKLPKDAFVRKYGPKGEYYRVDYDLGFTFGPAGIEFSFLYRAKVMGSVDAQYAH